ncbi:cytoplasmic tRNA 2-thiolation protein 2 [Drosophila madeirensis]|uniref:Cytoplasmic tRNA 2-thiolation protein 2 n=1 Tax=Drosophila madeirensis TaxID=30013 RepID=A0AAU9FEG8_DROMD
MCSIGEDDFGDEGAAHAMVAESLPTGILISPGDCSKCGVASNELYKLNFRVAECRDCFLIHCRHKFRAALGAAKVLPRNADVLLALDGSAESLVLLDMLHFAQTQNTFRRLHCNARVVYIDDQSVHGGESLNLHALQALSKRYEPLEFYVTEFGASPCSLQRLEEYSPAAKEPHTKLNKLRSLTARQDYHQQQLKNLLASVAQKLSCSHVFEARISGDLASQLLAAIALGRGGSAALDVALLDDRLVAGVKILRPLRDLNEQEVQFYVHARQLKPLRVTGSSYGQERGPTASLQNLTAAFVHNLQQNYPSTVSTVFRTGDKIIANAHAELDSCAHCQSPLDAKLSDTLLAIEYSRAVSEVGVGLSEHGDDSERLAKQRLAVKDGLCHACRCIQLELGSDLLT